MTKSRILVAEDDSSLALFMVSHLEANGLEVLLVDNGKAALAWVAKEAPDLIVLDIWPGQSDAAPQPNGLEVCRRIREWSQVPIIMISPRQDERSKVISFEAGADDYLTKHFAVEELVARIRAILRRKAMVYPVSGTHRSQQRP